MRIKEVTEVGILFDNGTEITDCCEELEHTETVYADFKYVTQLVEERDFLLNVAFPEEIQIQAVENAGFRFGGGDVWVFVPCYQVENGYYSNKLELIITYPDKTVKKVDISDTVQDFTD